MRHIWSLIAGVVLTPLAWFLIAIGQGEMSRGEVSAGVNNNLLLGGLLIVGVGLLLGLIGSLRTSPVGALVASAIFLGASVFYLLAPLDALGMFKAWKVAGYEANLSSPLTSGILAVVGGILLMAVFSPARWRGGPVATDEHTEWVPPATPEPWQAPVSTETSAEKTS